MSNKSITQNLTWIIQIVLVGLQTDPGQHDLGLIIGQLEDLAVRTAGEPPHISLIWALGSAGRAAASTRPEVRTQLLLAAQGHAAAALSQHQRICCPLPTGE